MQEWLKKFPEKRKRIASEEITGLQYWAGHLVYRIFKQKIERRKGKQDQAQFLGKPKLDDIQQLPKIQNKFRRTFRLPPI